MLTLISGWKIFQWFAGARSVLDQSGSIVAAIALMIGLLAGVTGNAAHHWSKDRAVAAAVAAAVAVERKAADTRTIKALETRDLEWERAFSRGMEALREAASAAQREVAESDVKRARERADERDRHAAEIRRLTAIRVKKQLSEACRLCRVPADRVRVRPGPAGESAGTERSSGASYPRSSAASPGGDARSPGMLAGGACGGIRLLGRGVGGSPVV